MSVKKLWPVAALLLGIVLGFLRANELLNSFGPNGLPVWDRSNWVGGSSLVMLCAAVGIGLLMLALSVVSKPDDREYSVAFSEKLLPRVFLTAGGLLLMAAAAADVASGATSQMSRLVLAALAAFAGIALAASVAVKADRRLSNFCVLVPSAFACYLLIIVYRDRTSDPVLWKYIYEMLAVVLAAFMFYQISGYAFGRIHPRRAYFASLAALVLTTAVTTAAVIYAVKTGGAPHGDAPMAAYLAAITVCALGSSLALATGSPQTET